MTTMFTTKGSLQAVQAMGNGFYRRVSLTVVILASWGHVACRPGIAESTLGGVREQ